MITIRMVKTDALGELIIMVSKLFPCSNFIFNVCIIFKFCEFWNVSLKEGGNYNNRRTIMPFSCLTEKQLFVNYLVMKEVILTIMQYLLTYQSPNDFTMNFGCCSFFFISFKPATSSQVFTDALYFMADVIAYNLDKGC